MSGTVKSTTVLKSDYKDYRNFIQSYKSGKKVDLDCSDSGVSSLQSLTNSSNNSCSSKEDLSSDIADFSSKNYEPEVKKTEIFINLNEKSKNDHNENVTKNYVNNVSKKFENIEEKNENGETKKTVLFRSNSVKKMSQMFENNSAKSTQRNFVNKANSYRNINKTINLNTGKFENVPKDVISSDSYKTESVEEIRRLIQRSKSQENLDDSDETPNKTETVQEIHNIAQMSKSKEHLIHSSIRPPPILCICPQKIETKSVIQNSKSEESLTTETVTPQSSEKIEETLSEARTKSEENLIKEINGLTQKTHQFSFEETRTEHLQVTKTVKTTTKASFKPPQSPKPKLASKPPTNFSPPPPPPEFTEPIPQNVTVSEQTSTGFVPPPPQFLEVKSITQNQISSENCNSKPGNFIPPPPQYIPQNLSENQNSSQRFINSEVNQAEEDFTFPPPPPPLAPPLPQANGKVENMHKTVVTPNLTKNNSKNETNQQVFAVKNGKTQKVDHVVVKNVNSTDCQDIDKNHPVFKKLVYGQLRGMYGTYHDKANEYVATMPKNRVKESHGVQNIIETIASQGGLEKLSGRANPKKDEE